MSGVKRAISTGIQDFEALRVNGDFYVDKTDFIREWWTGRDIVTLITRPRRFGKTLNISMLNCFFSNKYENRPELFEGLKVWEDPDMRKQQGKWPVISLSFAGVKATSYEQTRLEINEKLSQILNPYASMMQDPMFTDLDRRPERTRDSGRADFEVRFRFPGKGMPDPERMNDPD